MKLIQIPNTNKKVELADDYQFIAMNWMGQWHAYKNKPKIKLDMFGHEQLEWDSQNDNEFKIAYTPELCKTINWKESLLEIKDLVVKRDGEGRILDLLENKRSDKLPPEYDDEILGWLPIPKKMVNNEGACMKTNAAEMNLLAENISDGVRGFVNFAHRVPKRFT